MAKWRDGCLPSTMSPASESVNYIPVKDGDVIRLQFSVYGYGADLGYDTESYTGIPKLQMANRDALLKEVAETNEKKDYWMAYPNVKSAYDKAFQVAKEYNPTQKNVDNALAALHGSKEETHISYSENRFHKNS